MTKEILLSKEKVAFLNNLMTMTGEKIYKEYGRGGGDLNN